MIRKLICMVLIAVLGLSMVGCNQATAAALVKIAGGAVDGLLAVIAPTYPQRATLKADFALAAQQVADWKPGTPSENVTQALNLVLTDLSIISQVVPMTPQVQALIGLSITTVEAVLAVLPHKAGGKKGLIVGAPKSPAEFKAQWNSIVAQHPELEKAKL